MKSLPGDIEPTNLLAEIGARSRFGGLWRHRDFMRLWAGQTISKLGSTDRARGAAATPRSWCSAQRLCRWGCWAAAGALPLLLLGYRRASGLIACVAARS